MAGTPFLAVLLIEVGRCDRNILYSLPPALSSPVSKLSFYKFIHWSTVNHAKHSRPLVLCEFSVTGFYSFWCDQSPESHYRLISGFSLEQSTCKTRGKAAFDCVKRSMKLGADRLAHKRNIRIF